MNLSPSERLDRIENLLEQGSWQSVFKNNLEEVLIGDVEEKFLFERLSDPSWLKPLMEFGYFNTPPQKKIVESGGIIFPFWPQSECLARLAKEAPETVFEIISGIPETDNERIHGDFAEAALHMSPELAAEITEREIQWIKNEEHSWLYEEKFAELAAYLAGNQKRETALKLFTVLMEIFPDEEAERKRQSESFLDTLNPRTRFDTWHYQQILQNHVKVMTEQCEMPFLNIVCDLLHRAVDYSKKHDDSNDFSMIWRPAVEDNEENSDLQDIKGILAVAVRDAGIVLLENGFGKNVFAKIESYQETIFKRIGIDLRRRFFQVDREATSALVSSYEVFDSVSLRHELFHLLREHFNELTQEAQNDYLSFVEAGPDIEEWQESDEEQGLEITDGIRQSQIKWWQYRRLLPVQEYLDGKWKQIFQDLNNEFSKDDSGLLPDFETSSRVRAMRRVPGADVDFQKLCVDEIVSYLKNWGPSNDLMGATYDTVGSDLRAVVAEAPERFASKAHRFRLVRREYVREFLSGLRDALNKGDNFAWEPVFDLCRWVFQQSDSDIVLGERSNWWSEDPHWGWVRGAVAELLTEAFRQSQRRKVEIIAFEHRMTVWELIVPITNDPNPTPEDEAESSSSPFQHAINTVRGRGIEAAFMYALWVHRNMNAQPDGQEHIKRDFDEMPEVRKVLDHHLEIQNDSSLAIRSMYGRFFPQLAALDKEWAEANVEKIFPSDETLSDYFYAAWESYLFFSPIYINVFKMLEAKYDMVVNRLGEESKQRESKESEKPNERLAHHLVTLYWWGILDLNEPEGLLNRFFERTSPGERTEAISFIGQNLNKSVAEVPEEDLKRLTVLFEKRLEYYKQHPEETGGAEELGQFALWFSSGRFDDDWAVSILKEVILMVPDLRRFKFKIAKELAKFSERKPKEAMECLELLIDNGSDASGIWGWGRDHVKIVLEKAIRSENPETRRVSKECINRLISRGNFEYRDLLPKSTQD